MRNDISTAEAVRRWVMAAPAESILDVREAPGAPSNATRVALSHLASEPDSQVSFLRRHIYWKNQYPADRWGDGFAEPVDWVAVVLHLAGPGSGSAGYAAARLFGWTHQVMIAPAVSVVGRAPRGFDGRVDICSRRNASRRILSMYEVALLEATIGFILYGFDIEYKPGHSHYCMYDTDPHDDAECLWDWPDAVDAFTTELRNRPDWSAHFHPARLVQVADNEWLGGSEMRCKIADLADAISDIEKDRAS